MSLLSKTLFRTSKPNVVRAFIDPAYDVYVMPNGGRLALQCLHAIRMCLSDNPKTAGHVDPVSLSVAFHSVCKSGRDADISVDVVRTTRSQTTVVATLGQDGDPKLQVLALFGSHGARKGMSVPGTQRRIAAVPPVPTSTMWNEMTERGPVPVSRTVDCRPLPGSELVVGPMRCRTEPVRVPPTDRIEFTTFIKPRNGEALGVAHAAFLADCLPPPILRHPEAARSWIPTLTYTVNFFGHFAQDEEWAIARYTTRNVMDGHLETDTDVFSAKTGELVATSRQMARVVPNAVKSKM